MLAGGIGMTLDEAAKEFELDCKIQHLSPKTIEIYLSLLIRAENKSTCRDHLGGKENDPVVA